MLPDGLALAVDHGVRGHDAVRGGVSLHNLHRNVNLGRHVELTNVQVLDVGLNIEHYI